MNTSTVGTRAHKCFKDILYSYNQGGMEGVWQGTRVQQVSVPSSADSVCAGGYIEPTLVSFAKDLKGCEHGPTQRGKFRSTLTGVFLKDKYSSIELLLPLSLYETTI